MTDMIDAPPDLQHQLVVGLEVHVELATRSKMWTTAPNVAHPDHQDAPPNTLLDPVVIGMPGTLPVMNREAVRMSIMVGLALHCSIADRCQWDRKSYYYPDLPKNYQISQYDQPLCFDGHVDLPGDDPADEPTRIRILRAHLEEDAGKLLHERPGGGSIEHSIVDLNRAGTPLLEIVTEPDFRHASQVVRFCERLRRLVRHLGVSQAIMQRGQIRFEPNINVRIQRAGRTYKTPIVEIKNLNSFRAVEGSIRHEHQRQIDAWLADGQVMGEGNKQTRGWDDARGVTTVQREKEDAQDYRYFPDPDLVEVHVDDGWRERVAAAMPPTPEEVAARWAEAGVSADDAEALLNEPATTQFFESLLAEGVEATQAVKLMRNALARLANDADKPVDELGISAGQVAAGVAMQVAGKISAGGLDKLLVALATAGDPAAEVAAVAESAGLLQVSDDGQLASWVDQVLGDTRNAKTVETIRGGNAKAIGALMGGVMKLSRGSANPQAVQQMIRERLGV